jgi:biopolymer transport protein ExbD
MSDADVPLSPAQRSKIRRLSAPKEAEAGEEAGELNIVPYLDIIMNILMFVLASVAVTFITSIDTTPPSKGGGKVRADVSSKALNLNVFIVNEGISVKTSGGNLAPGCQEPGSGIAIPKVNGVNDYTSLTACAKRIKNLRPEFKEEDQVTIVANADVDFKTIIATMDALRADGEEELFPDVHFGAVR